jgi:hypothetical protein
MKRKGSLCAICGMSAATTKDHIPPQSLYPRPRDNKINLNTVPACAQCNNEASRDDEVFKVLVGIDTGEHQSEPEKIVESLAKTIARNKRIADQVFASHHRTYANLSGASLQPAVVVTFDFSQYQRVIDRIVRGLHWMETGSAMPIKAAVQVIPAIQCEALIATDFMALMHLLPLKKLNQETFAYRWHAPPEGEQVWGLQFFGRHTVFALVLPPSKSVGSM